MIWGLMDMKLIKKYGKRFCFLLGVIDIYVNTRELFP